MAAKRPKVEKTEETLPAPIAAAAGGAGGGDGGDDGHNLIAAPLEGSSEVQAAVLMAKKFPRVEGQAQAEIMAICDQEIFAAGAFYAFPRGKKLNEKTGEWEPNIVTGPSIRMAREAARIYGNFRYGFIITHEDDDGRQIVAYAWDVQKNNRTTSSDYFKKLIQRRIGGTTIPVTPDERELRELTNRRASILMRNCILSLLPAYFVDAAVLVCRKTVGGGGKGVDDLGDRAQKMQAAFAEIGISTAQLEAYLKKPIAETTREDLGELRGIYDSLRDGVISPQERNDLFGGHGPREEPKGPGLDEPKLSEADMRPAGQKLADPTKLDPAKDTQAAGGEPFPIKDGAQEEAATGTGGDLRELTTPQKRALAAALKATKKTRPELEAYMNRRWEVSGLDLLTEEQYDDALAWAEFIPPQDPKPAEKKTAAKKAAPELTAPQKEKVKELAESLKPPAKQPGNGKTEPTDPKQMALDLIARMTAETFKDLRPRVLELCSEIHGTKQILEVTIALGEAHNKYGKKTP